MFRQFSLLFVAIATCCFTSCQAQRPHNNLPPDGQWALEFKSNDIGLVRMFMSFEFKDSVFSARSRSGADRDILGFWKSLLGRTFTSDFKHGALLNITDGKTQRRGDTLLLSGIFRSALGNYYFRGSVCNDRIEARLLTRSKEIKGWINGRIAGNTQPPCNYPGLVENVLSVTAKNIYNAAALKSSQWRQFGENIRSASKLMQDDLEMEFAFFYYGGKLPFSHYALMRQAPDTADTNGKSPYEKQLVLLEKTPETLYMNIKSFNGSAEEMDSAFALISQKKYRNLIIDLRENPGGNIEPGMSMARHLADTVFYGGVFLTQKWFGQHSAPPAVADYSKLPAFSDRDFDLLINGIHTQPGLCLQVRPQQPVYKGRLFILTSGVTASTCEPIVYGLKQHKRATLVGAKTAGAMLNGEFFPLGDGFSVFLPTADYYATDGFHIDQQGVNPNLAVEPAKALDVVMEQFINK